MHLVSGYTINNGDLSTMTPLQYLATNCISKIIFDFKADNKPFAVI